MSEEIKPTSSQGQNTKIDYDHIDVARIVEQIKAKVADEVRQEAEASGGEEPGAEISYFPDLDLEDAGEPAARGRIRGLVLKLMTPFRPLIKLMILPVYEEYRQTVRILHKTNKRLDYFYRIKDRDHLANVERLDRLKSYTKILHSLAHNLVVEISKLKIEHEMLKTQVRILEKDLEFLSQRERSLEQEVFK
jgi:hypothetical protein